jgi:DNA-binding NarL/FixJ family response regulator
MTARLVLVDDHAIVREGLRTLLEVEGFEVVGEAGDAESAMPLIAELHPDVVLMDLLMPGMNGLDATRELVARHPDLRILVLSSATEELLVRQALDAGAWGYLPKEVGRVALGEAIRGIVEGRRMVHPEAERALKDGLRNLRGAPLEELTPREQSVLELLAEGRSNRQIGGRLGLTEGTVKGYVSTVLDKLGAQDRTEAVLFAQRVGLVMRS